MSDKKMAKPVQGGFRCWSWKDTWKMWPKTIARLPLIFPLWYVLVTVSLVTACTQNLPYRTADAVHCEGDSCDPSTFLEEHDNENYDLAFVEFSERGNVFSRERMNEILRFVGDRAKLDPAQPENGILTIVFVHGWKHNASGSDENVASFRRLLVNVGKVSSRRVVGVYVGWRGLSVNWGDVFTNVSYWDRKATAEQVARGGVTELLLRLEKEVILDDGDGIPPNRNLYFVTGHSFGGAVVLAALSEVMLERIARGDAIADDRNCIETRPFGHGVVLLNPAIEANEALPLKELVAENCFGPRQVRLLHVISSDADVATNQFFRVGQALGVNLTWKQAELSRMFDGKEVVLQESDLDTITIGNFKPFQTGQLDRSPSNLTDWQYLTCVGEQLNCLDEADRLEHIPVESNEPLAFIQTDVNFISDHNDVFNNNVSAYLAAVMAEARYKLTLYGDDEDQRLPAECRSSAFGPCFKVYQDLFRKIEEEKKSGA